MAQEPLGSVSRGSSTGVTEQDSSWLSRDSFPLQPLCQLQAPHGTELSKVWTAVKSQG